LILHQKTHAVPNAHHPPQNRPRRTAAITPRGIGTRPKSTFARGLRTRFGLSTTAAPGRNTCVSIASIRHNGRKIRTACGHAWSSATISGVSSTVRSCNPNPAARQAAAFTSHPKSRGQIRSAAARRTPRAFPSATGAAPPTVSRRVSRPASNRATIRSIRPQISPNRRCTSSANAALNHPRKLQPPNDPRKPWITADRLKEGETQEFMTKFLAYDTAKCNEKSRGGRRRQPKPRSTKGSSSFLKKKNQETFKRYRMTIRKNTRKRLKVFCFFSSEKKALLP
jgi:hypothetical protein